MRQLLLFLPTFLPQEKICGLKSHSAVLGCSRCLKKFPGNFGEKRDYSGFDRRTWISRTNEDHRRQATKMSKSKTKAERNSIGQKSGISHYSILLEYFDIIRFCTVDPMHSLFLGTSKKMLQLWTDLKLFSKSQLNEIEERIKSMEVPSDIGRLPMQISSNCGSYTAEQWKNWTLIYSIYCLKGILPDEHFRCWQMFVLACRYLCQPVISKTDLDIADGLILKFCKAVESLYGKDVITQNMHLRKPFKRGHSRSWTCDQFLVL